MRADPTSSRQNVGVVFQNVIYDCMIGWNYWDRRSVTFDVSGKTLIISVK